VILAGARVEVNSPHAVWGLQELPTYAFTDFPALSGMWARGLDSGQSGVDACALETALVAIRLPERAVPHAIGGVQPASPPVLMWTHVPSAFTAVGSRPGIGTVYKLTHDGLDFYHWYESTRAYPDIRSVLCEESASESGWSTPRRMYVRGEWQMFRASFFAEPSGNGGVFQLFFGVADADAGDSDPWHWFILEFGVRVPMRVLYARGSPTSVLDGDNFVGSPVKLVEGDPQFGQFTSERLMEYREEPRASEWLRTVDALVTPNRLQVRVSGSALPLLLPLRDLTGSATDPADDTETPYTEQPPKLMWIRAVQMRWSSLRRVRVSGYPVYFAPVAEWKSSEHALGFAPVSPPTYEIRMLNDVDVPNTSVSVITDDFTLGKYRLRLSGDTGVVGSETVALRTPLVHAVTPRYEGRYYQQPAQGQYLFPNEISVAQRFDLNRLQIQASASLSFLDTDGSVWRALRRSGLRACRIHMSRYAFDDTGAPLPSRSAVEYPVFSGYLNTDCSTHSLSHGHLRTTVQAVDRSLQLRTPRWWLPWMDGWNVYYAMAYLAELGGIPRSQLGFAALVPNAPFDEVPGSNAWFLPVGNAGTPLTRFSGQDLWDIMSRIAYAIGYMLFFDVNGVLQFRKYAIPDGVSVIFVDEDVWVDSFPDAPSRAALAGRVHRSLFGVRNSVTVVGVDAYAPLWYPIVSHRVDMGSVYDTTAENFIGFRNPMVWTDTQFARLEYARRAANRVASVVARPVMHMQIQTRLCPEVYAGDVVGVVMPRLDLTERFLVLGVQHSISEGSAGMTMLDLRYIPPGAEGVPS
jgi:hypothetical protein